MTDISPDPMQVLRTVLETDNDALSELDEECSPTKTCRNMVGVTFDGFAEPGSDIGAAWRQKLARCVLQTKSKGTLLDVRIEISNDQSSKRSLSQKCW
jgi:hypothetical protein